MMSIMKQSLAALALLGSVGGSVGVVPCHGLTLKMSPKKKARNAKRKEQEAARKKMWARRRKMLKEGKQRKRSEGKETGFEIRVTEKFHRARDQVEEVREKFHREREEQAKKDASEIKLSSKSDVSIQKKPQTITNADFISESDRDIFISSFGKKNDSFGVHLYDKDVCEPIPYSNKTKDECGEMVVKQGKCEPSQGCAHPSKKLGEGEWGSAFGIKHKGKEYALKVVLDEHAFMDPQFQQLGADAHGLAWEFKVMKDHILKRGLEKDLQKRLENDQDNTENANGIGRVSYIKFHALGRMEIPLSERQKNWLKDETWKRKTSSVLYTKEQEAELESLSKKLKQGEKVDLFLPSWTKNVLIMERVVGFVTPGEEHVSLWQAVQKAAKLNVNIHGRLYFYDTDRHVQKLGATYKELNVFCLKNKETGRPELKLYDFGLWLPQSEDYTTNAEIVRSIQTLTLREKEVVPKKMVNKSCEEEPAKKMVVAQKENVQKENKENAKSMYRSQKVPKMHRSQKNFGRVLGSQKNFGRVSRSHKNFGRELKNIM